jgi:protein-S-isoprenylcysteine O-methyltransferase Ste14
MRSFWLAPMPAIVACPYILIASEERNLAAEFGEEYRIYAAKVHRRVARNRISY